MKEKIIGYPKGLEGREEFVLSERDLQTYDGKLCRDYEYMFFKEKELLDSPEYELAGGHKPSFDSNRDIRIPIGPVDYDTEVVKKIIENCKKDGIKIRGKNNKGTEIVYTVSGESEPPEIAYLVEFIGRRDPKESVTMDNLENVLMAGMVIGRIEYKPDRVEMKNDISIKLGSCYLNPERILESEKLSKVFAYITRISPVLENMKKVFKANYNAVNPIEDDQLYGDYKGEQLRKLRDMEFELERKKRGLLYGPFMSSPI